MKGIFFGNYHSYDDFHLVLNSKEVGSPSAKTIEIDIPGADGILDMTEFFGSVKFGNVKHKFQFQTIVPQHDFLSLFSDIKNKIHGQMIRIIIDDDPYFYYVGRCFVSAFTNDRNVGSVSVECDCEPYRYKIAETVVTQQISGEADITLTNMFKRVVPEITIASEGTLHIVYETYNIWDLASGVYALPELELKPGNNVVSVSGTGSITFRYQEGGL